MLSWHSLCFEGSCQLDDFSQEFLGIIPRQNEPSKKLASQHFTRNRKLTFPKLVPFLLSIVASAKAKGVEVKSGEFFRAAKRSGLWPEAEAVHHSAISKARKEVHWHIFRDILNDAVRLAYSAGPKTRDLLGTACRSTV